MLAVGGGEREGETNHIWMKADASLNELADGAHRNFRVPFQDRAPIVRGSFARHGFRPTAQAIRSRSITYRSKS